MQYVDCEKLAGEAPAAADVAARRPSGRCLRQRFLAPLESNLSRSFSSFPASEEYKAMYLCESRCVLEVMVVGEGLLGALRLALRVVACGNAFSLRSNRTLVEASHPSRMGWIWGTERSVNSIQHGSDGGGGRIRTFEVDDGRFTVCSLWPLGNPTRGNSNFEVKLRDGGGEGLFVASLLTLPDKCKHRLRSSVLPQQRGKEWWWGKDSNLRSR